MKVLDRALVEINEAKRMKLQDFGVQTLLKNVQVPVVYDPTLWEK